MGRMERRAGCWIAAALCCLLALACSKNGDLSAPGPVAVQPSAAVADPQLPPYFEDVTATSGVQFSYRNGEEAGHLALPEGLGGGVGLIDYDGDGLLDIFLPGGGYFVGKTLHGYPCRLYRNLGGWRFRDVTAEVGLDQGLLYTHGCAVGDYDNDGWPDLLVTGYGGVILYHNEPDGKGGRRFVNVTARAGLTDTLWATSAAWGDLNGDGYLDLYVTHYVDWSFANHPRCPGYVPDQAVAICSPRHYTARPHTQIYNTGDATFRAARRGAGRRR
jgi:hypothetical protein